MKLLLDQGLPRSAASLLRTVGIDTVHTGEVGLATANDQIIIEWARTEQRIIVTLDADFHAHLALSEASSPSIHSHTHGRFTISSNLRIVTNDYLGLA